MSQSLGLNPEVESRRKYIEYLPPQSLNHTCRTDSKCVSKIIYFKFCDIGSMEHISGRTSLQWEGTPKVVI